MCYYTTFNKKDGTYAISLDTLNGTAFIYRSHVFFRYRERIVKDDSIETQDLIKRFMVRNKDVAWVLNTESFSAAYKKYERDNVPQMAVRIAEGNGFVERLGENLYLMKTILSDEMLSGNQISAFSDLENMRKSFVPR